MLAKSANTLISFILGDWSVNRSHDWFSSIDCLFFGFNSLAVFFDLVDHSCHNAADRCLAAIHLRNYFLKTVEVPIDFPVILRVWDWFFLFLKPSHAWLYGHALTSIALSTLGRPCVFGHCLRIWFGSRLASTALGIFSSFFFKSTLFSLSFFLNLSSFLLFLPLDSSLFFFFLTDFAWP